MAVQESTALNQETTMRTRAPLFTTILAAGLVATPILAFGQGSTMPMTPSQTPGQMPGQMQAQGMMTTPAAPLLQAGPRSRASNLIGSTIYNERNESVGKVDDLIIDLARGPITAVVSVGGFLGIGDKLVSVPLSELAWDATRERWTLTGATKESLTARAAFTYSAG